jgi:predicted transposase YbfD/YdcC
MSAPVNVDAYAQLLSALSVLEDPRSPRGRLHALSDVLAIVVLAVLCGCNNAEAFEDWGRKEEAWLSTVLQLPNGIPSQDTYLRVLSALDPDKFRRAFLTWVQRVFAPLGISNQVAIDGKTLRGSRSAAAQQAAVHMVSALVCQSGLVMGQVRTADKSNEIVAIPEVLKLLSLQGALVSIDAMGCQRDIAQQIVDSGGDYLLQVKDNQPTLRSELSTLFSQVTATPEHRPLDSAAVPPVSWHQQTDGEHGRIETRKTAVCYEFPDYFSTQTLWPQLSTVVMVEASRQNVVTGHQSIERHYYISSRPQMDAQQAASAVRAHWLIENQLHWVLDMTFGEDSCTVRAHHGAENLAVVRHFAYNLLRRCSDKKSMRRRQRLCDWDHGYRLRVLQGGV